MFSLEIDTDRLILGLDSYRDALLGSGRDASNVVKDEVRYLSKYITSFLPPIAHGRAARQIGLDAVERDIKNLVSEATTELIDEVGAKYGISNINRAYVTEATGVHLNLQWEHLDPTGTRLEEYWAQYRDSDGRIPKVKSPSGVWKSRVVVPVGTRARLIAKLQQHVGNLKASWAQAGAALGDSYPHWIRRHFGNGLGIVNKDSLNNPTAPSTTFGSRAGGNRRWQHQIQTVVKKRAGAVRRKVQLLLSAYNKDLAQGMKARAKARQFHDEAPEVT